MVSSRSQPRRDPAGSDTVAHDARAAPVRALSCGGTASESQLTSKDYHSVFRSLVLRKEGVKCSLSVASAPELPQQARRLLDIREQERHRSPGTVLPHQRIMHGCPRTITRTK